jgi:hypothetical protein
VEAKGWRVLWGGLAISPQDRQTLKNSTVKHFLSAKLLLVLTQRLCQCDLSSSPLEQRLL